MSVCGGFEVIGVNVCRGMLPLWIALFSVKTKGTVKHVNVLIC